jgi:hypothetical protein
VPCSACAEKDVAAISVHAAEVKMAARGIRGHTKLSFGDM